MHAQACMEECDIMGYMYYSTTILYNLDSKIEAYFRKEGLNDRLAHKIQNVRGLTFKEGLAFGRGLTFQFIE